MSDYDVLRELRGWREKWQTNESITMERLNERLNAQMRLKKEVANSLQIRA